MPVRLSELEPDREQGGGYEDTGMETKNPSGAMAIAEGRNLGLMGFVGTTAYLVWGEWDWNYYSLSKAKMREGNVRAVPS